MIKRRTNSVSLWLFESLLGYGEIKHFISSRTGGSSCRPWDSLNLSFNTLDDAKAVLDNRQHLSEALQIPLTSITTAKQVHGRHVRILSRSLKGRGACDYHSAINSTDAMVTDVPGICPVVLLADCVPILMYDPSKRVVGVVHAGWKGTLGTIAQKTVEIFRKDFGSMPEEIIACIGPSIGPCCFQVGHEVITQIENAFGTNFKKSYEWVKENDTSRPAIFSYPGNVPDSIASYDILSMHYPGISGNMNQINKKTKAFGYAQMPVIFDEWAHVACYNNSTVMEDPNVRGFWGQSLDSMWQKTFEADGGLGGAIWGMIDETFMLPDTLSGFNDWWGKIDERVIPAAYVGNTIGYGEWGIIDTWRKKKPEFWNTKKAYSPIRLLQTIFEDYENGTALTVPIYNRFDHTNLNEITIEWQYKDVKKLLPATDLKPHQKGSISIPVENWLAEESISVNFYDSQNRLIDAYNLQQVQKEPEESPVSRKGNIAVEEDDETLTLRLENNTTLVFDKKTGLITKLQTGTETILCSGPYLNLRTKGKPVMYSYHEINEYGEGWSLKDFSYRKEKSSVLVSLKGKYAGKIKTVFDIKINQDGTLGINYAIENVPDEWLREAGIKFLFDDAFDALSWERKGYWSVYPEDHLSRPIGRAALYPTILNKYREKPEKEWAENTKSFYYFGTENESSRELTNIARASKENIKTFSLLKKDQKVISVLGNENVACRLNKKGDYLVLHINNKWDYVDLSWGNFQKNIKLDKNYNGKVKFMINATQ